MAFTTQFKRSELVEFTEKRYFLLINFAISVYHLLELINILATRKVMNVILINLTCFDMVQNGCLEKAIFMVDHM